MGWEQRGRGSFFYRSVRIGGRVLKQYCGCGPAAEAAAREDAERRVARAAQQGSEQRRRQTYEAAVEQVAAVSGELDSLLQMALVAAGYHRHCRHAWRRKRGKREC